MINDIQYVIDRQIGIYCRPSYDHILKRLVVDSEEAFYRLRSSFVPPALDQDPPIFACRFAEASGYEHILALATEDGRVAIQNTSSLSAASTVEGFQCHNNAVFNLAWMPGFMNFVTVSGDHTACLWDVAGGSVKRVQMFSNHTRSVKTAVFRPNEPTVFATGARDGHILVWDIRQAQIQPAIILKPDNCLMNCHSTFTPKTPGSHSKRPRLDSHRAISITGLVFQDDQTLISCGECDGNIKVWDMRKNYSIYKRDPLAKHSIPYCGSSAKNGYSNLIVDDSRVRLYASCMDNVIYCFNMSAYSTSLEQRYFGHENSTFYIKTCLSPDSMYLVSGSSDKNAYIWNVKCSQPVVKLAGHRAEVTCAAWCRAGCFRLATCSDDARHKLWRLGPVPDPESRAHLVPREDLCALPHWGASHKTLSSNKRKIPVIPNTHLAKRIKTPSDPVKKTKRCQVDLMNSSKEDDDIDEYGKRLKLDIPKNQTDEEQKILPAGVKRRREQYYSPVKKYMHDKSTSDVACDRSYSPQAGASCMTPTKNYEKKSGNHCSPKVPKPLLPNSPTQRTPLKGCQNKLRIMTFNTPTKNLPNFVLNGEAPHLRLMSPVKKKPNTSNWLTLLSQKKKGKVEGNTTARPSQAAEMPARRNSTTKKNSKSTGKKSDSLLKYFTVTGRDQ